MLTVVSGEPARGERVRAAVPRRGLTSARGATGSLGQRFTLPLTESASRVETRLWEGVPPESAAGKSPWGGPGRGSRGAGIGVELPAVKREAQQAGGEDVCWPAARRPLAAHQPPGLGFPWPVAADAPPRPCWMCSSVCLWQAPGHCGQSGLALAARQAAPRGGDSDEGLVPVMSGDVATGRREHV